MLHYENNDAVEAQMRQINGLYNQIKTDISISSVSKIQLQCEVEKLLSLIK